MRGLARPGLYAALAVFVAAVIVLARDPWPPRWYEWGVIGAAALSAVATVIVDVLRPKRWEPGLWQRRSTDG